MGEFLYNLGVEKAMTQIHKQQTNAISKAQDKLEKIFATDVTKGPNTNIKRAIQKITNLIKNRQDT